jgi:hypothetical protein
MFADLLSTDPQYLGRVNLLPSAMGEVLLGDDPRTHHGLIKSPPWLRRLALLRQ